jgi:HEAT repeat protein
LPGGTAPNALDPHPVDREDALVKSTGRNVALTVSLLGVLTVAAGAVALKEQIADRWYLWKLAHAPAVGRKEIIEILLHRRCAAVIPDLLRDWQAHPFEGGSIGWKMGHLRFQVDQLQSFGPSAIPYLAAALNDGGVESERWVILEALRDFGPRLEPVLPELMRFLDQGDPLNMMSALILIGAIGPGAAPEVPALLKFGWSPDEFTRYGLYRCLRDLGPPGACPAVPLLLEVLSNEKGQSLEMAAEALERIEPDRPETLDAIMACMRDEDQIAREQAAYLASRLGERGKAAVRALIGLIPGDGEPDVRGASIVEDR